MDLQERLIAAGYTLYEILEQDYNSVKFRESLLSDWKCAIAEKDGIVVYNHKGLQVAFLEIT